MIFKRVISSLGLVAALMFTTTAGNCPQGGNDAGDGDGPDLSDLDPRAAALITALIDYVEECNQTQGPDYRLYEVLDPDYQGSTSFDLGTVYGTIFATAFRSPYVEVNYEDVEACTALYDGLECDADISDVQARPCVDMIKGTRARGESCYGVFDCEDDLSCDMDDEESCGTCEPNTSDAGGASEGESCDDTYCDDGLVELYDDMDACTCVTRPEEGDSCEDVYDCAEGLAQFYGPDGCVCQVPVADGQPCVDTTTYEAIAACDVDSNCSYDTGLCEGPGALGETCTGGRGCVDGLYCDYENDVCLAEVVGDAAGDACSVGVYDSCGWIYETALHCDENEDGTGTCADVEVAELGEACNESDGTYCRNTFTKAFCDFDYDSGTGACRPRGEPGDVCNWDAPCHYQSRCVRPGGGDDGNCVALPGEGEDCLEGSYCASGLFCGQDEVCKSFDSYAADYREMAETCWESDAG